MFSDINISQGSVATRLTRGGIVNDSFIANFLLNVAVEEFWKSVNIWRSYGEEFGVFLTHGVHTHFYLEACRLIALLSL